MHDRNLMTRICLVLGVWLLYVTWKGVVPEGPKAWGKSEAGQRMRRGQRMLYGIGAFIFLGMALLLYETR
jgi:hypothetical protein